MRRQKRRRGNEAFISSWWDASGYDIDKLKEVQDPVGWMPDVRTIKVRNSTYLCSQFNLFIVGQCINRKMSAVDERVAEKRKMDEKDAENGVAAKGAKLENGITAAVGGDTQVKDLKDKNAFLKEGSDKATNENHDGEHEEDIEDGADGEDGVEESSGGEDDESLGDEEDAGSDDDEASIVSEESDGQGDGDGGDFGDDDDVEGEDGGESEE
ncbi:unnamed protein product [Thelazia callipaeda]|uniref:WWE domain-containing protein n=1 Tax=Thelazia callipaeda TaxID=103827 RepID=A0A158RCX3_THECL|nr:unnamed protein product [Thelazia callipaeda]